MGDYRPSGGGRSRRRDLRTSYKQSPRLLGLDDKSLVTDDRDTRKKCFFVCGGRRRTRKRPSPPKEGSCIRTYYLLIGPTLLLSVWESCFSPLDVEEEEWEEMTIGLGRERGRPRQVLGRCSLGGPSVSSDRRARCLCPSLRWKIVLGGPLSLRISWKSSGPGSEYNY